MFSEHVGTDVLLTAVHLTWKKYFEQSSVFATEVILNVDFK